MLESLVEKKETLIVKLISVLVFKLITYNKSFLLRFYTYFIRSISKLLITLR